MKTQEAAFRQSWKPKKVKKEVAPQDPATPKGIVKNAKRNDRRKAGRAKRSLEKALRAQRGEPEPEKVKKVKAGKGKAAAEGKVEGVVEEKKKGDVKMEGAEEESSSEEDGGAGVEKKDEESSEESSDEESS